MATEADKANKANYAQPDTPKTIHQAMNDPRFNTIGWKESVEEEIKGIFDDKVWHLEPKPTDEPMIDLLTTFTVNLDGRMKTRICARGDQED